MMPSLHRMRAPVLRGALRPWSAAAAAADQPQPPPPSRLDVLRAALKHVPERGWSEEALALGAVDVGLAPVAHGMFSRGGIELVEFFMEDAARETSRTVENRRGELLDGKSDADKVKAVIKLRLQLLVPFIGTWSQAMALGLLPRNAPTTLRNLGLLTDELCHAAGQQDTDLRWYQQRSLVGGVYAASETYMLTDSSVDFQNTWDFVDRRVDGLMGGAGVGLNPHEKLVAAHAVAEAAATAAASVLPETLRQATNRPGNPLHTTQDALKASAELAFNLASSVLPPGAAPQMPSFHQRPSHAAPREDDPNATTDADRAEFAAEAPLK